MMPDPFRDTYWNVPDWARSTVYFAGAVAVLLLIFGLVRLWRRWDQGAKPRLPRIDGDRLRRVWREVIVQARVRSDRRAGVMHLLIFWGTLLLFVGTVLSSLDYWVHHILGPKILAGPFYAVYELVLDLAGLAAVTGIMIAIWQRYVKPVVRLERGARFGVTLALLLGVNLTGFMVEALRLAATEPAWGGWSFAGQGLALLAEAFGLDGAAARSWHQVMWVVHLASALIAIVLIPYLNLAHLFTSPLHIFAHRRNPAAVPLVPAIVEVPVVGVDRVADLNWRQRLELDACTECGRCEQACPAWLAGQPLSPKRVVLNLKSALAHSDGAGPTTSTLAGIVVPVQAIWACTTCQACAQICPVLVDPSGLIVDLRRGLVDRGEPPPSVIGPLEDTRILDSAWGEPPSARSANLCEMGLHAPGSGDMPSLIYWVGDTSTYDLQAREIPRAVSHLLKTAGIQAGSLGAGDGTDGEAARRLGEEGLFQQVARRRIEALRDASASRILTHCPHLYNTVRNEYPDLGGSFAVVHHSEFLLELLASGRLNPTRELERCVTYHDPCYLARYNGMMEPPRALLRRLPGITLVEMPRNRENSFCCGGGGGMMWLDVASGQRINYLRFREAALLNVDVIVTACPYCKIMLTEAAGACSSPIQVKDVAELLLETLPEGVRT